MDNLQSLHLDTNKLETLPASFERLVSLKLLYLHQNNITTLPLNLLDFWQNKKLEHYLKGKQTCEKAYGSVVYTDS